MAEGDVRKVEMVRRSRATGGKVLLPGKKYTVSEADFLDLVRSGKGVDPTGDIRTRQRKSHTAGSRFDQEHPGGEGESTQTLGSSRTRKPRPKAAGKK